MELRCGAVDPHERFIGFLIEHYAGNFPLWLSPEQVRVQLVLGYHRDEARKQTGKSGIVREELELAEV